MASQLGDISDESDFYGDEKETTRLETRVEDFDPSNWLEQQYLHPGRPVPNALTVQDISHLHNPYKGRVCAWQLTETVQSFLERLPPATTLFSPTVPWIFICNPFIQRQDKDESEPKQKGNEDEAPDEEGSNVQLVVDGGGERLELLSNFIDKVNSTNKTSAVREREIGKERKAAVADILHLAHAHKVRPGKWMLFCSPQEVNEMWDVVTKATASNELGIAAKVAPKAQDEDPRKDRIICVYTSDFHDKADVGRVLRKMREMKLVEARGRPIYYKPDAFTYIGIAHGNPWGLKASIYSSRDLFSSGMA